MQRFQRNNEPPPRDFTSIEADEIRRALRNFLETDAERLSQTSAPRRLLSLDDQTGIDALRRLFRGKCAFCEAKVDVFPHRFRPSTEATPTAIDGHLYYAWLADAWENIYPICELCRPENPTFFPVKGRRAPLPTEGQLNRYIEENNGLWRDYPPRENYILIDPCIHADFTRVLEPRRDGILIGLNERGATTIEVYKLNNAQRVRQRRECYRTQIEVLKAELRQPNTNRDWGEGSGLFDFESMAFGGTWFLLLRRIALGLGGAKTQRLTLSMATINRIFGALSLEQDSLPRLESALDALSADDADDRRIAIKSPAPRIGKAQLKTVTLKNFKAIEHISFAMPDPTVSSNRTEGTTIVKPVPSLIILGENAAGKSSILEGIAIALCDDDSRQELDLEPADFIMKPNYMGAVTNRARQEATITLSFDDGTNHTLRITADGFFDVGLNDRSRLPPVFAYGAFRQYKRSQRRFSSARYVNNLFHTDVVLAHPGKWLLSLRQNNFNMVVRALRDVLRIEGEFDVIRRDLVEQACYIVTSAASTEGEQRFSLTPLDAASSGFRTVLAMVCDLFRGLMDLRVNSSFESLLTVRAIVLIDEVEAHLHPRWKMTIMQGLRSAMPNITFVTTTHDPLCLRGMGDKDVLVLQRTARTPTSDNDLPVFIECISDLPPTSKLTVEQLLTSDFFQLFSADAPEVERHLAEIADIMARRQQGKSLSPEEHIAWSAFQRDIKEALPIGSSEAARIVQEAVAEFLKQRRTASDSTLKKIRKDTKEHILSVLKSVG